MKPVRQLSVLSPLLHGEPLALFMTGNIRRFISSQHLHNTESQGGGARPALGRCFFFLLISTFYWTVNHHPRLSAMDSFPKEQTHIKDLRDLFFLFSAWLLKVHSGKSEKCLENMGKVG